MPFSLARIQRLPRSAGKHVTLVGAVPRTSPVARRTRCTALAEGAVAVCSARCQLAWDAARGVPLRAAIYARGASKPVLALEATKITYGPVPRGEGRRRASCRRHEVQVPVPTQQEGNSPKKNRVDKSESKTAGFQVVAPDTAAGLKRTRRPRRRHGPGPRSSSTARGSARSRSLEPNRARARSGSAERSAGVRLDGVEGHELATPLGPSSSGARRRHYVLAGSVPPPRPSRPQTA